MTKITVQVQGMACGMCEKHVNEAVQKAFSVKKVTSSHSEGTTEILTASPPDEEKVRAVIEEAGYTVLGITSEPYEKKGFFRK